MADEGWGARAADWAYLLEPRWWPEFDQVLRDAGVAEGLDYLDVCCGSGLALQMARWRGAHVSGIDASNRLLDIARARVPDGDVRCGDMHALPWDDESYDVVTSFRGIWGANDRAVAEVARVLRPGGVLAVSFFPLDEPCAWDQWWVSLAKVSDHEIEVGQRLGSIAEDGRAEAMCDAAGLVPGDRRRLRFEIEGGPQLDDSVRASISAGPAWTAIKERGQDDVERALRRDFAAHTSGTVGVRIPTVVEYLLATKPT